MIGTLPLWFRQNPWLGDKLLLRSRVSLQSLSKLCFPQAPENSNVSLRKILDPLNNSLQFTVYHQNFFQKKKFLILEEIEKSSYLSLFCALQPSRYLSQEIKAIILASISNSECSDTGLFWLRMWVFSEMINGYYRWIQKIFSNRKWAEMHRTPQWYIKSMVWIKSNSNFTTTTWIWIFGPPYNSSLCTSDSYFR